MAFDGFAIFDPRPIAALAESLFPGNGSALMIVWPHAAVRISRGREHEFRCGCRNARWRLPVGSPGDADVSVEKPAARASSAA